MPVTLTMPLSPNILTAECVMYTKLCQGCMACCRFPNVERMGQEVLTIQQLTHGYQDRTLFKHCDFEMEKGERVVLIGVTALHWLCLRSCVKLWHKPVLLLSTGIACPAQLLAIGMLPEIVFVWDTKLHILLCVSSFGQADSHRSHQWQSAARDPRITPAYFAQKQADAVPDATVLC